MSISGIGSYKKVNFFVNFDSLATPHIGTAAFLREGLRIKGIRRSLYTSPSRNPKIGRILLDYGLLRLFCIRWENDIIILGYGGEKDPKKPKLIDNPDLMTIVKKLETVCDQISYYIKRNGLTIQEFLELEDK